MCLDYLYVATEPPSITYISDQTVSFEGRKVKLTCNAINDVDVDYPVQIKWYNSKGKQVQIVNKHVLIYNNTNNVTGEIQSVLFIDPVHHTDTGMYTCRAYNHPRCYNEDKVNLTVECELSVFVFVTKQLCWTRVHSISKEHIDVAMNLKPKSCNELLYFLNYNF